MKKFGAWAVGLALSAALCFSAFAANLPQVPSNPTFSDPSQIVGTLNQWGLFLSGQPNAMGTPATAGNFGLGTFCSASGATPQTCNGSRGAVTFTGVTVAGVATGAVVITNSLITTGSNCLGSIFSDNSAAGSFPYIRSMIPTAGTLTVNISNAAAATSTGSSTFGISFSCFN